VQVVAATNRDLRAEVSAGRFRSDLFYRLNVVSLRVPALRERREDLPYLSAHFIREFARRLQKPLLGLTTGGERLLHAAHWPGNVRELRNVIERACILADTDLLGEREIGECMPFSSSVPPPAALAEANAPRSNATVEPLSVVERDYVLRALQQSRGNKKAAAKMLGLSRRAFYRRLERYQLDDVIQRRVGLQPAQTPDSPARTPDSEAVA
jgi:DNA-binding NtrC family response regulator